MLRSNICALIMLGAGPVAMSFAQNAASEAPIRAIVAEHASAVPVEDLETSDRLRRHGHDVTVLILVERRIVGDQG